jgi:hypothetical protein
VNHAEAVMGLAFGLGIIYVAVTAEQFYALGPAQKLTPKTKIVPKWIGRALVSCSGGAVIYWSIIGLRGIWQWRDLYDALLLALFCAVFWSVPIIVKRLIKWIAQKP